MLKRILVEPLCSFLVVLFIAYTSSAQVPEVTKISHRFTDDGLKVSIDFNRDVSNLTQSKLKYQITTLTNDQIAEREIGFSPLTSSQKLEFVIPKADLERSKEIEYFAVLARPTQIIKTFPKNNVDLAFYQEQLKTVKNKLEQTESSLKTNTEKLVSAEKDLTETKIKLNAKQTELNQILEGIRPTSIVFDKENLVTDDKIAVSFTTNKPTKIRATIKNASFNKTIDTENVSSKHTVIFDGLSQNTQYKIDAVALDLATNNPIDTVAVNSEGNEKLKISTKNRINPPSANITHDASSNNIKIKVKPDQNVFAEILYTQLDESGAPIGRTQKIGAIKQDSVGIFSSDENVSGGSEKDFDLANLKENTKYANQG